MKKTFLKSALIALATLGLTAGYANAGSYTFSDTIDTWTVLNINIDAIAILEGIPLQYTHDLTQEVDFANGNKVTDATLELDFTNDSYDRKIIWNFEEHALVGFNGSTWVNLGDVDNDQYSLILDIDWLNDDGLLDVTIKVSNPYNIIPAVAWLDHSKLYGTAETPEPATMLLFGTGIAGLAGVARRKKK